MTATVTKLSEVPKQPQCNQEVIGVLEEILEAARSGDIVDVAVAVICDDGIAKRWLSGCGSSVPLIGAVALLQRDLLELE